MNVLRTGGAGSPPAAVVQGADAGDGSGLTEQGYPPGESPSIFFIRSSLAAAAAAPRPLALRSASPGLRFSTHGRGAGCRAQQNPGCDRLLQLAGMHCASEAEIMLFGGNNASLSLC